MLIWLVPSNDNGTIKETPKEKYRTDRCLGKGLQVLAFPVVCIQWMLEGQLEECGSVATCDSMENKGDATGQSL